MDYDTDSKDDYSRSQLVCGSSHAAFVDAETCQMVDNWIKSDDEDNQITFDAGKEKDTQTNSENSNSEPINNSEDSVTYN